MSPVHYFILQRIAKWLNEHVLPANVAEVYSPAREEVLFHFRKKRSFFLHMVCAGALPGLRMPESYNRPRRNTTNIFTEIETCQAVKAGVVPYDRILWVRMDDGRLIVFKCFPRQANVLLLDDGYAILERFRNGLDQGETFPFNSGSWVPENALTEGSLQTRSDLKKISGVWDKDCQLAAESALDINMPFTEVVSMVHTTGCEAPLHIIPSKGMPVLTPFLPNPTAVSSGYDNILQALTLYTTAFYRVHEYRILHDAIERELDKAVLKAQGLLKGATEGIQGLEAERSAEELGNLIISNLYKIQPGQKVLEVFDYYTERKVRIKLKPELNGLENAEGYFRKHKKRREQIKYLQGILAQKTADLLTAQARLNAFQKLPDPDFYPWNQGLPEDWPLRQLRMLIRTQERDESKTQLPYRMLDAEGFQIRYGTNAKMNDQLTLHHAHKEDYWLHARDVPGAHVIICHKSGMNPPSTVLEVAAGIAAYLSKRRTESLVPVTLTRRKFVRKRKGMAPGEVEVEREDVVMAAPVDPVTLSG